MAVFYNENDPFAVLWLRELIKECVIADGIVDERSIEELTAKDLEGYTQCHFFAGIGVWSYALRSAGWSDDTRVWTGSCPCQPFSASGKRGGFDDKRHLWPAWYRLIKECRPDVLFGEQVAAKDGLAWIDLVSSDLENENYTFGAVDLCAAGFGAPHLRQRLYFVADTKSSECEGPGGARPGWKRLTNAGSTSELGNADSSRPQGRSELIGAGGSELVTRKAGASFELADTNQDRCESGGVVRSDGKELHVKYGSTEDSFELADTDGGSQSDGGIQRSGEYGQRTQNGCAGFWSNAIWIPCRDGKWRPTEPTIFSLVNGAPNRLGTLRGAGNAIVAEVAKEFIKAYMSI